MTKRFALTIALLLPATADAGPVIQWRDCFHLAAAQPVRPKPVEPDAQDNGPFHAPAPAPSARTRQWINPTQHAEVYLDAAGVTRYDPSTVVQVSCPYGVCPR